MTFYAQQINSVAFNPCLIADRVILATCAGELLCHSFEKRQKLVADISRSENMLSGSLFRSSHALRDFWRLRKTLKEINKEEFKLNMCSELLAVHIKNHYFQLWKQSCCTQKVYWFLEIDLRTFVIQTKFSFVRSALSSISSCAS